MDPMLAELDLNRRPLARKKPPSNIDWADSKDWLSREVLNPNPVNYFETRGCVYS
jgi:hypothetical protein